MSLVDTESSIPIPLPVRRRSSSVCVLRHQSGSEAVALDAQPRALIVDDCRFIAERVARVLEQRGFECTIAPNGYKGLEFARGCRFDLFVLDVDMPMLNGFSLLRHLRRDPVHAETPVLMLASSNTQIDRDLAVELGASATMTKPLQQRPLNLTLDSITE